MSRQTLRVLPFQVVSYFPPQLILYLQGETVHYLSIYYSEMVTLLVLERHMLCQMFWNFYSTANHCGVTNA